MPPFDVVVVVLPELVEDEVEDEVDELVELDEVTLPEVELLVELDDETLPDELDEVDE